MREYSRSPFVVPAELSLRYLVNMFQMLEFEQCFVLGGGWYVGTLTREGLSMALSQVNIDSSYSYYYHYFCYYYYYCCYSSFSSLDGAVTDDSFFYNSSFYVPRLAAPGDLTR